MLGIDRYYREEAGDGAFTSPTFIQKVLAEILAHIPESSMRCALDLGSGSGGNLNVLSTCFPTVVASDISLRVLRRSREAHPFAAFAASDVHSLPFRSVAFDVIVCTEVFEHVLDLRRAINECRRVLRDGGYLVVSTPNYGNLVGLVKWYKDWRSRRRSWEPWGAHEGGMERFMTARTMDRALENDFRILERRGVDYFQSWLFPFRPLRRYYGKFLLLSAGRSPLLRGVGMHHFVLAEKRA